MLFARAPREGLPCRRAGAADPLAQESSMLCAEYLPTPLISRIHELSHNPLANF